MRGAAAAAAAAAAVAVATAVTRRLAAFIEEDVRVLGHTVFSSGEAGCSRVIQVVPLLVQHVADASCVVPAAEAPEVVADREQVEHAPSSCFFCRVGHVAAQIQLLDREVYEGVHFVPVVPRIAETFQVEDEHVR